MKSSLAILFTVAKRRLEAGAGTPLHLNTARVRLAEATRETVYARGAKRVATVRLAELVGLAPDTRLTAVGELPDAGSSAGVEQILVEQSQTRPDLVSAASDVDAASAEIALADARAWPELSLGVSYGRDDNATIFLLTLGLSLPLFNRNQGARDAARARQARVSAEYDALSIAAGAEMRRALLEYNEAREAAGIYDTDVIRAQRESLQLLTRALEVGEVGIGEIIIMQREIAVGNQGYLEARLALARARAGLRAAAGLPQTKHTKGNTQ